MAAREDFIWVRAKAGLGEVVFVHGNLVVRVSESKTQEVTRGEWTTILEPLGLFEIGPAPEPIAISTGRRPGRTQDPEQKAKD